MYKKNILRKIKFFPNISIDTVHRYGNIKIDLSP